MGGVGDGEDEGVTAAEFDALTLLRPWSWCLAFLTVVYAGFQFYAWVTGQNASAGSSKKGYRRRTLPNPFVPRASLLDLAGGSILTPWTKPEIPGVIDPKLFGWYSMGTVALLAWVINRIALNVVERGGPLMHPGYFIIMVETLPEVATAMLCQHAFTYSALLLQIVLQRSQLDPTSISIVMIQHFLQATLVLFSLWVVLSRPWWGLTGKAGVCAWTMTNYMKMHSYIEVHRQVWLARKSLDSGNSNTSAEAKIDSKSKMLDILREVHNIGGSWVNELAEDTLRDLIDEATTSQKRLLAAAKEYPRTTQDTCRDFAVYIWMPCVVYEWSFPRTTRIRIWYVAEKIVLSCLLMTAIWMVMDAYLFPTFAIIHRLHPVRAVYQLALPELLLAVLIFFLVFECILNALGELTYFADRKFYEPWWNSTTFDEFARDWNKPVHEFLLRHVYIELIARRGSARWIALLITFVFSMALHEVIFAVCFAMFRPWFAMFGLTQLPLNVLMANPLFKGTRLGNFIFWYGLITGIPVISIMYTREYCAVAGNCSV